MHHPSIGYTYVGEWQDDAIHGYGKSDPRFSVSDAVAEQAAHRLAFAGEFTYANGAKYAGQWANNMYNGYGKYVFPDGSTYEGNWVDNQMHGVGKFIDAKAVSWEGQFYHGTGPGLSTVIA